MEIPLLIMVVQGCLGAFDTIYYHEYVCQLPVHGPKVKGELRLHALRDFVYGLLFLSLPMVKWNGLLTVLLCLLILLEICITIWDFNIEAVERLSIGGIANTERGLHLIMAVIYGIFLAHLAPHLWSWFHQPTGFEWQLGISNWIRMLCVVMGAGVILSGLRDLLAAHGVTFFQKDLFGRSSSGLQPSPRE